jgi:hypothetical protein
VRAQLYVALDAGHISDAEFKLLRGEVESCSGKISRFMAYLRERNVQRKAAPASPR